jgi:hypothetical protein
MVMNAISEARLGLRRHVAGIMAVVVAVLTLTFAHAPSAQAQGAGSGGPCDEYILSLCGGSGGGGGETSPNGRASGEETKGRSAGGTGRGHAKQNGPEDNDDSSSGVHLPFTRYPLTPLVAVMLGVVTASLLIRSGIAVRARLQGRHVRHDEGAL